MDFIKELFIGRKIYLTTDLLRTVYTMVMLMSGAASPMRGIIGRELLL